MQHSQRPAQADKPKNPDVGRLGRIARGNALIATNDEPERGVCIKCVVCGGETKPGFNGLCTACRGLARIFANTGWGGA